MVSQEELYCINSGIQEYNVRFLLPSLSWLDTADTAVLVVVLIADLTSLRNRVFFSYVPAMPSLMYVTTSALVSAQRKLIKVTLG